MPSLIALGDRYWALGLPAAARSVFERALAGDDAATAAQRLTDIALAQGDATSARGYAADAVKRAPGPATRILLARAQLASGELAAARMSLMVALEAAVVAPWDRARIHLELARAGEAHADHAGAAAHAATAFEAALAASATGETADTFVLVEEICAMVVAHKRASDAMETLATHSSAAHTMRAALLAARQAAGEPIGDREVDDALAAVGSAAGSIRRFERRARNPSLADRNQLTSELAAAIAGWTAEELSPIERARLHFVYGALCADDPATRSLAEEAYRKGLSYQPGHTGAACRLALLMLDRGDQQGALGEIERALRIDARAGLAWRNAARMLDAQSPSLGVVVGRLLDAANPGAGSVAGGVAPRLVTATAEVARSEVLAGVYAHGHRVKNLLGIIGSRARSARKSAEGVNDALLGRLRELEKDVTALYEEWAQYLRSMQSPTPNIELVPLAPLLHEVVVAAQARSQQVAITLEIQGSLPDMRGDRTLLREAVLNIVSNAAEACTPRGGEVALRARAVAVAGGASAPIVELVVVDTGPGIPRAHLARLFVPGFTTKETGSGVGLAIAERVVAAHHGRITVESEEGRGTTISITLPTDKTGLLSLPLWTANERSTS